MDLRLGDKVAWVTGAGSGIGASIATTLAEHGCKVYLADSNVAAVSKVAAECGERGYPLEFDVGERVMPPLLSSGSCASSSASTSSSTTRAF